MAHSSSKNGVSHFLSTLPVLFVVKDKYAIYYGGSDGEVLGVGLLCPAGVYSKQNREMIGSRAEQFSDVAKNALLVANKYLQTSICAALAGTSPVTIEISPSTSTEGYTTITNEYLISHDSLDNYHRSVRVRELKKWFTDPTVGIELQVVGHEGLQTQHKQLVIDINLKDLMELHTDELQHVHIFSDQLRNWGSEHGERQKSVAKSSLTYRPSIIYAKPPVSLAEIPFPKNFLPSEKLTMLKEDRARVDNGGDAELSKYRSRRFSAVYRKKFMKLPDHRNTSVWITGIPKSVTYSDFFQIIDVGGVVGLTLVPPSADNKHADQAANLIFTHPQSAKAFIQQDKYFAGQKLNVSYNRHGTERFSNSDQTRVLEIEGPKESVMMSYDSWDKYFSRICVYDYEHVRYLKPEVEGNIQMEFRFTRIKGQAETLMQAIRKTPKFDGVIKVRYGKDPCDPYRHAGRRNKELMGRQFEISLNINSRRLRQPKFDN